MKRAFILASFSPSLVNFRGALIEAFLDKGYEVHACAPGLSGDPATSRWLEERGVVCHDAAFTRTGMNPLRDAGAVMQLVRLMRRVKPSLFLGYTIKPIIWGLIAARLAGVSKRNAMVTGLGYTFTGNATGRRAVIKAIVRRLYRRALREAQVILFQNTDDRDEMTRLGLIPDGAKVEIVNGSGVDLQAFAHTPLPDGPTIRFLMIARLLGDKGVREYVAAARQMSASAPQTEFHLVGDFDPNPDGISQAEMNAWVEDGHVAWTGPMSDVRPALQACTVYVLPSYREGTPRTVLEAMATGRAVITTDAPGCRETVVDGVNGFLVPVRDADALAHAMRRFLDEPAIAGSMGSAGRRVAEEKYDVHKVNQAILRAIDA
ncbi:glycosyltransferase family 4 protein [Hasllibacter sp. MH4015]|uniref:glycosyltransferase family 4 protein n=1 Tax=Hasllibacter sp. MH4015 TaxID=2854029 RepID=UPI001CD7CD0C|nr:glycosyltransferase family 4 protein [Hasllibacter sp. MH4015]